MKNIFKIMALALAAISVIACDLTEKDPNHPELDEAFASAQSIQYVINDFYGAFPTVSGAYSQEPGRVDYFPKNTMTARFSSGYTASSSNDDDWGSWKRVRRLNYFLELLNDPKYYANITDEQRVDFIAQARFFRAYTYFDMVRQYGDVQWYDHVVAIDDPDDEFKDRDSRDLVIKNILDDLDYAIENMTATSPDGTCISKEVAQFIKMRVCLYEASFRKYNNITKSVTGESFANYSVNSLYKLAADTAKDIIDLGKYSLLKDYRKLFTETNLQLDEVILGAQTSATIKGSQNNYFAYNGSDDPKSFCRSFINTYLMKDGTPYTDKAGYETESWKAEFEDRDPRLSKIVRYPGYKYDGTVVVPDFGCSRIGYQVIKFCLDAPQDKTTAVPDEKDKSNSNSTPILRYAEVLLDYAEAKAELGEMTDEIWALTIGAIRKRAGITGGNANTGTLTTMPTGAVDSYLQTNFYPDVTDPIIMEIRRERSCELCLEGQRGSDILRWGCGNLILDMPWDGIIVAGFDKYGNPVSGLDVDIDLDGDGVLDVYFSNKGSKSSSNSNVATIPVNAKNNLLVSKKVGSSIQLSYKSEYIKKVSEARYWAPDGHLLLDAIPSRVLEHYEQRGYSITQNPGY